MFSADQVQSFTMSYTCAICSDLWEIEPDDLSRPERGKSNVIKISSVDCGHVFHSSCIKTWLKDNSSCPVCRVTSLVIRELHPGCAETVPKSVREEELEKQLEILRSENASLLSNLKKEKRQSNSWARRNNECQDQLDDLKSQITSLKRENEQFKTQNHVLRLEISAFKLRLDNLTKEIHVEIDKKIKTCFKDDVGSKPDNDHPESTSPKIEMRSSVSINLGSIPKTNTNIPQPSQCVETVSPSSLKSGNPFPFLETIFGRSEYNYPPKLVPKPFVSHTCNCVSSLCSHGNCGCTRKNIPCNSTCYCQRVNGGVICHNPWTKPTDKPGTLFTFGSN